MADSHAGLLADLLAFIKDEQAAAEHKLLEIWSRPLVEKLQSGWSQAFSRLEPSGDPTAIWAHVEEADSRFREGDLLLLHAGDALEQRLARGLTLECEDEGRWLLRGRRVRALLHAGTEGPFFADPDTMDLTEHYEQAIQGIATSQIGREVVLPLLAGELKISFVPQDVAAGMSAALASGFNARQAEAVGMAFGADQVACIQGPPGTGKSSVLALIARLMVERGERVLVTSHTHMAINNALNRIQREGVPAVKIGLPSHRKGLDDAVACHPSFAVWADRPAQGYVVGATPFATCTFRLQNCEFDAILFDEASQVTVPLALMAMRKGRRFVFVGDHRQLPPVLLTRSVLDAEPDSVFAALASRAAGHAVMLEDTYRMNRWLTAWPSGAYYANRLRAAGANEQRQLKLTATPERLAAVFDPQACGIFIPTLDRGARTRNLRDAQLVAELCAAAIAGGLPAHDIGIVTPYRAQGRAVRELLRKGLGSAMARAVVADTVERMQGQEREMIILSLATGDTVFLQAVAEFFFQPQRLNVAITRPKTKLIVIGPEPTAVPEPEPALLRRWIADYVDLVGHLRRVPL
jgi:DNA replication ATP-dependent helicase Dna2